MINERDRHIWRLIAAGAGLFCDASHRLFPAVSPPSTSMHWVTDAMTIFAIAVGVTALFCYVVARQSQSRRVNRTSSGDSPWSADTGYDTRDSGHHHHGGSADHSASDHSGPSGDAGGGDSGGAEAAAMVEEVATAVVAAIRAVPENRIACVVVPVPQLLLDSF
jgi:hypothetical protein